MHTAFRRSCIPALDVLAPWPRQVARAGGLGVMQIRRWAITWKGSLVEAATAAMATGR